MGQVASMAGCFPGLPSRRGEDRLQLRITRRGGAPCHPQLIRQGEQPLLRAVVEIALKAAAFGVARFHDPGPGRAKILQLGQDPGPEPFVVHREPGSRPDRPLKPVSIGTAGSWRTMATSRPSRRILVTVFPPPGAASCTVLPDPSTNRPDSGSQ